MQGDKIKIRVQNMEYFVTGGSFQSLLAAVKALPNRRYIGAQKLWLVEGSPEMVRGQIENSGFLLEGGTPVSKDAASVPISANDSIKIEAAGFTATVTGAPFAELLAAIKALPERRFNGDSKRWTIGGSMPELKNYFEKKEWQLNDIIATSTPLSQPAAPTLPDFPADFSPPPPEDDFSDFDDPGFDVPTLPVPDDTFPPPIETAAPTPAASVKPTATSARRDQIRVVVGNRQLAIVGGSFQEMLAAVKDIPGRRFDGATKMWLLPDDVESVQQHLNSKGFRLEEV